MHVLLGSLSFGYGLGAWAEYALQDVLGEELCVRPQHDEVVVYALELVIHALDLLFLVPSLHGVLLALWEEHRVHRLSP